PDRRTAVAPAPVVTVAACALIEETSASANAPEPPIARPGGTRCMSAANPIIGAVAGWDIGGPDCAPNQDSAALRRSEENVESSSASPDEKKVGTAPHGSRRSCGPRKAPPSRAAVGRAAKPFIM